MPIEYKEKHAIRAIKGDASGSSGTDSLGNPTNVEFVRIYKGSDLKFDKWEEDWLCFNNPGSSAITLNISKQGTGWSSDVVLKYVVSSAMSTEQTLTFAAGTSSSQGLTIPANGRLYLKNGNSSQNYLSIGTSNYVKIGSSSSHYVTGNYLALSPGAKTSGTLASFAFYRLFQGNTKVTSVPDFCMLVNGNKITTAGKNYVFGMMFYGCSSLTKIPAFTVDAEGSTHLLSQAFYSCSAATSCGDLDLSSCGSNMLRQAYYQCTSLTQGPAITIANGFIAANGLYQTFYYCTAMTSVRNIKVRSIADSGMYRTFYNCTQFTGSGLTGYFETVSPSELTNKVYCADIFLDGSSALQQCFTDCTNLEMAFGAWRDPSQMTNTRYLVNFQFRGIYSNRMGGTFSNSGLMQNSFSCIYLGDVGTCGTKEWGESDLYQTFLGCTSITDATHIFWPRFFMPDRITPRTQLRTGAYASVFREMFYGCTSLQYAKLPDGYMGYQQMFCKMFYGCTALQRVQGSTPKSSASGSGGSDASGMYESMFEGCTSLIYSPILQIGDIKPVGMYRMFYGCTALRAIITNQNDFSNVSESGTTDWTYGTTNGTSSDKRYFINLRSDVTYTSADCNASGNTTSGDAYRIPYGWQIINGPVCITPNMGSVSVKLYKEGTPDGTHTFTYLNLTNGTQATYTPTNNPTALTSDAMILFWGTSTTGQLSNSASAYYRFYITGSASVSGNIGNLCKMTSSVVSPKDYCYYRLFYGCVGITDASGLTGFSGTAMANYRYRETFKGCANLISAPAIAMNVGTYQYTFYRMFDGCESLVTPPTLVNCSASSAGATGTFECMFLDCTSLTSVADLPSASDMPMARELFMGMYQGCTSLESIPSGYLPWTTVGVNCYQYMFAGCTSLVDVPYDLLPATTLADGCYANMFDGCTSLVIAPDLNASSTGTIYSYNRIFYNCSSLAYIKVNFTAWSAADITHRATWDWTYGVPTTGSFWCPAALTDYRNNSTNTGNNVSVGDGCTDTGASYIPYGWTKHSSGASSDWTDTDNMLIFTRTAGSIRINAVSGTSAGKLQYTTNGISWSDLGTSGPTLTSSVTKVGIRAKSNLTPLTSTNQAHLSFTVSSGTPKMDVSGNVTRFYCTNYYADTDASYLFYNNQYIGDCSGMYFTGTNISARSMFSQSSVTKVNRNLLISRGTAKISDNFRNMFLGCASLTQGPHLYAASLVKPRDFMGIFQNCTSLVSSASSNTIEVGCPVPQGTTTTKFSSAGDSGEYHNGYASAFKGCTAIQAVKVNFNYLGKDYEMNNLKRTFDSCFYGCSNLSVIKCKAMRWPILGCTNDWVYGVADSGTFYRYTGNSLGVQHSRDRMPAGWTVTETTWT